MNIFFFLLFTTGVTQTQNFDLVTEERRYTIEIIEKRLNTVKTTGFFRRV